MSKKLENHLYAVITGDLINSSKMETKERDHVLNVLKQEFEKLKKITPVNFSIFRGDSFQGVVDAPEEALRVALIIKTLLNQLEQENKNGRTTKGAKPYFNARMALGIGTIQFLKSNPEESDGEAFRYSGRSLDEMKKKDQKLIIKSPWEEVNEEFETECKLLDTITEKWLTASAQVIYFLLSGLKEQEIATKLNVTQSAVNQRKKGAHWDAVDLLLTRYKNLILSRKEF